MIRLQSIAEFNARHGVQTRHPLVTVADLSAVPPVPTGVVMQYGFYCIFLKESGSSLKYGRTTGDGQAGALVFAGPGQTMGQSSAVRALHQLRGWVLAFHPDLLSGTSLGRTLRQYSFFSYQADEALHLSEEEKAQVLGIFRDIRAELDREPDSYSQRLLVLHIEVLLNHCSRFYDRQFAARIKGNGGLLGRFETLLAAYMDSGRPIEEGLPSVAWCAAELGFSAKYFGDLIKRQSGMSAQEYIQRAVIQHVKAELSDGGKSISTIAYDTGFQFPQHLSRLFRKITGLTPTQYREREIR